MKIIYESFAEFADDFVAGESMAHCGSRHTADECFGWQKGVKEFARWIDAAGGKLLCETDTHEKLWNAWHDTANPATADQSHPPAKE
jgi:hypothetical protein